MSNEEQNKNQVSPKKANTSVVIVDDSAGVRNTWSQLINTFSGFECVATCTSGEEALRKIPALKPDVVLMDIQMTGLNGIETTARLKAQCPETQVLMVTVHGDNERVFAALEAGASGYLLKRSAREDLLYALEEIMRGDAPMTSEIARKVIDVFRRPASNLQADEKLTPREAEVLKFLTQGFSNKEIAERLDVSFDTIRNHLRHIYKKLHVRGRTEAATKYLKSMRIGSGKGPDHPYTFEL